MFDQMIGQNMIVIKLKHGLEAGAESNFRIHDLRVPPVPPTRQKGHVFESIDQSQTLISRELEAPIGHRKSSEIKSNTKEIQLVNARAHVHVRKSAWRGTHPWSGTTLPTLYTGLLD